MSGSGNASSRARGKAPGGGAPPVVASPASVWEGAESLSPLLTPLLALSEDPRNARKHSDRNLQAIEDSLREHGQQKPIVAAEDGTVIAGNGTLRAASRLGWTHLAVVRYQGSAESAKRFALQDNRTAELAAWDSEALTEMLAELSGLDLESFGAAWTPDELVALVGDLGDLSGVESVSLEPPAGERPLATLPGGAPSVPASDPSQAGVPSSGIRMVQLFLSEAQHEEFVSVVRGLGSVYGLSTVTETVLEAVKRAAAIPESSP